MALVFNMVGGSSGSSILREKDVNFYDYDGTLIASYTTIEAQVLSALPVAPNHSTDAIPLTFQSWNHTLAQVNAVTYKLNVGATYIPTDGKTHILLSLNSITGYAVPIWFNKSDNSTLTLTLKNSAGDTVWSTTTTSTSGVVNISGVSTAGMYDLQWEITSGTGTYGLGGNNSASQSCIGGPSAGYRPCVQAIHIGNNVPCIQWYAFNDSRALLKVTFPNSVKSFYPYVFSSCKSLHAVVFPKDTTAISGDAFSYCPALSMISIPCGVTSLGDFVFAGCNSLCEISLPESLTTYPAAMFNQCNGIILYDFTRYTYIPSLPSPNAFDGISGACRMKIPSALFTAWSTTSNWSTYKSFMDAY